MVFLYVSLFICVLGVIANVFMAILLTRPRLATTINRLLACITLSDALLMCSYLIYIAHFEFIPKNRCPVDKLTFGWVLFQLLHTNWSVYLRAFSLWLSVAMAGYRKHVLSKTKPHRSERIIFPIKLGLGVAVCVLLICLPIFLQNTVVEGPRAPENNSFCPRNHSPYYAVRTADIATWNDGLLLKAAYWTNGILLKLCPCIFLTYYLVRVVCLMYARHRKRQDTLFKNRKPQSTLGQSGDSNNVRSIMMPTSLILVTVLLVTVLCEMPNAILSVMTGLFPHLFLKNAYAHLGAMMDLLSLFSCTSTSILYFVMSRSLREAFLATFCPFSKEQDQSGTSRSVVMNIVAKEEDLEAGDSKKEFL